MGSADDAVKARADLTIADHLQPGIAEVSRTRVWTVIIWPVDYRADVSAPHG